MADLGLISPFVTPCLRCWRRNSALDERLIHLKESLESFLTFTLERPWWMLLGKILQTGGFTVEHGPPPRLVGAWTERTRDPLQL